MTVVIKKSYNKKNIEQELKKLGTQNNFNAFKYCGIVKLSSSPKTIQKKMRDEWT